VARRGVLLRLIGVAVLVGVLCVVCLGTASAATTAAAPTTAAATQSGELPNTGVGNGMTLAALGLFATLCGAGVLICWRRATR
jgi:LPXTG-motif cell wall-anchored protein